ncbi:MAG: tyrosine-type recombinase/integrase [Bacteroidota bacterium]
MHTGKSWYISYYAYEPVSESLRIKRMKINYIGNGTERRRYACELMKRLNNNLALGWNPFLEQEANKACKKLTDAIDHFLKVNEKKHESGDIRTETWVGYRSYMKNLIKYLQTKGCEDMYVYKFDRQFISNFLDYIYVDRDRTSQTRDNYLAVLRVFSTFLVDKDYLKVRPTESLSSLGKKRRGKKNRTVLEPEDRKRLREYLEAENLHYLLACQVLYYCFIRPKEMSYMKVSHINMINRTIFIPGKTAKNYKDSIVTMPIPLVRLLEKIDLSNFPGQFYLFSNDFQPGPKRRDEKQFRDYWLKIRKKLKFPVTYKFYSLKDTGITDLIGQIGDPRMVRDQARHHSISITDIYTPHDIMKANPIIAQNEAEF